MKVLFQNLTKFEKKYNKTFFVDYIKTNIFFKKYYKDRYKKSKKCYYWMEYKNIICTYIYLDIKINIIILLIYT